MPSLDTKENDGLFDEPNGKSLFKEISNAKTAIDEHYYRIDVIERNLAQKEMTFEERDKLELELRAIRDVLTKTEEELKALHGHNRQTTQVAAMIMLLSLFIYCIYCLIVNKN